MSELCGERMDIGKAFMLEMSIPRDDDEKRRHKEFIVEIQSLELGALIQEGIKWHQRFSDSPHLYEDWFSYRRTLLVSEELRRRGCDAAISESEERGCTKMLFDYLASFGCKQFSGEAYG